MFDGTASKKIVDDAREEEAATIRKQLSGCAVMQDHVLQKNVGNVRGAGSRQRSRDGITSRVICSD